MSIDPLFLLLGPVVTWFPFVMSGGPLSIQTLDTFVAMAVLRAVISGLLVPAVISECIGKLPIARPRDARTELPC